ncbi:cupin domain-containing protein [Planctomonas sp. JC2975]|uniref:cupin domain-containing protein n=1 Tax=Planctomonas sp. JC2975 TaxID=2729626 RepID=UPI0014743DDC|nr:cupin domain-containing protein [Planctomonas sp. JC2975]NNC11169.1 cupin domain-containing protein [Planctomonas sp. JC2975]
MSSSDVQRSVSEDRIRPALAERLDLERHPEGGWFRRTWTSPVSVELPRGERAAASLIHYLLEDGESSAWHVVQSDEIWLWHGPGRLGLRLGGTGDAPVEGTTSMLGPDILAGDRAQAVVPAGVWQRTLPAAGETLVSCLVSPEFSFDDWKLSSTAG